MKKRGLLHILFFIVVALAISAVVMLLWNWLMPTIFGLISISYFQALGLLALSRILFGGFKLWRHGHGMMHHKHPGFRGHWDKMSPEQQKAFIERRRKFGFGHDFSHHTAAEQKSDEQ